MSIEPVQRSALVNQLRITQYRKERGYRCNPRNGGERHHDREDLRPHHASSLPRGEYAPNVEQQIHVAVALA